MRGVTSTSPIVAKVIRSIFRKVDMFQWYRKVLDSLWDEEGPFCFKRRFICLRPLKRLDKGLIKLIKLHYSLIHFRICNNMGYHIRSSGTSESMLYVRNANK